MVVSRRRVDVRVARFVRRLEPRAESIAAVVRATGEFCERLDVTRPSYEQIRLLTHAARERRERRRAAIELVLDVDFRRRPLSDLDYLSGDPRDAPPPRGWHRTSTRHR